MIFNKDYCILNLECKYVFFNEIVVFLIFINILNLNIGFLLVVC